MVYQGVAVGIGLFFSLILYFNRKPLKLSRNGLILFTVASIVLNLSFPYLFKSINFVCILIAVLIFISTATHFILRIEKEKSDESTDRFQAVLVLEVAESDKVHTNEQDVKIYEVEITQKEDLEEVQQLENLFDQEVFEPSQIEKDQPNHEDQLQIEQIETEKMLPIHNIEGDQEESNISLSDIEVGSEPIIENSTTIEVQLEEGTSEQEVAINDTDHSEVPHSLLLGLEAHQEGDLITAIRHYTDAVTQGLEMNDLLMVTIDLYRVYYKLGLYTKARQMIELTIYQQEGNIPEDLYRELKKKRAHLELLEKELVMS